MDFYFFYYFLFREYNDGRLKLDKEKIIKNIRNLLILKKEKIYTAIKYLRKLFRLEKETKPFKDRILRDIKKRFLHEEENYHKPGRKMNFWSNNYIEYESSGDRNKTLSAEEYFKKIRPY